RRASTVVISASTCAPSYRATVTAGVAVSKASSSTDAKPNRPPRSVWPSGCPAGSLQLGQHVPGRGGSPGLELAGRHWPVATAAGVALQHRGDQDVVVPDHYRHQVGGDPARADVLDRGERLAAQPGQRADRGPGQVGRPGWPGLLRQRLLIAVDGRERGA